MWQAKCLAFLGVKFSSVQKLESKLKEAQKVSDVAIILMKTSVVVDRQRAVSITALEREIEVLKSRLKNGGKRVATPPSLEQNKEVVIS